MRPPNLFDTVSEGLLSVNCMILEITAWVNQNGPVAVGVNAAALQVIPMPPRCAGIIFSSDTCHDDSDLLCTVLYF